MRIAAVLSSHRSAHASAAKRALAAAEAAHGLGERHLSDGRYGEAEPLLRRALSIKQKVLGRSDPALAGDLKRLAYAWSAQQKFREAAPLLTSARAMVKRALGSRYPEIVTALRELAKTCREQERFRDSARLLEVSIAIIEAARGPEQPETEKTLEFYSEMLRVLRLDAPAAKD